MQKFEFLQCRKIKIHPWRKCITKWHKSQQYEEITLNHIREINVLHHEAFPYAPLRILDAQSRKEPFYHDVISVDFHQTYSTFLDEEMNFNFSGPILFRFPYMYDEVVILGSFNREKAHHLIAGKPSIQLCCAQFHSTKDKSNKSHMIYTRSGFKMKKVP